MTKLIKPVGHRRGQKVINGAKTYSVWLGEYNNDARKYAWRVDAEPTERTRMSPRGG